MASDRGLKIKHPKAPIDRFRIDIMKKYPQVLNNLSVLM